MILSALADVDGSGCGVGVAVADGEVDGWIVEVGEKRGTQDDERAPCGIFLDLYIEP